MKRGTVAELDSQSFSDVFETDPGLFRACVWTWRGQGIDHPEDQGFSIHCDINAYGNGRLRVGEAVYHRILDERLQDETRNPHGGTCLGIRNDDDQPVSKSPLLQLKIQSHKVQLVVQPRELMFSGLQRTAHEIA